MTKPRLAEVADLAPDREEFLEDVWRGLAQPRKQLPCKYLYDEEGSRLFERICELDEYYLTRTELAILEAHAHEMARALGPACLFVEYGSGSGRKTRLLLDRLEKPAAYVPVDISRSALESATAALARCYPGLEILPVCADYTRAHELPEPQTPPARCVVYFPGSTIGNFSPEEAGRFLRSVRERVGDQGAFLGGVDLKKDPAVLEAAYDDREGVTAAFNLNLLARVNRELDADFDLAGFEHEAVYDEKLGRVEMRLVSRVDQTVRVRGRSFRFARGERIHTESSYKYDLDQFRALARDAGFELAHVWSDRAGRFSVPYLTPLGPA